MPFFNWDSLHARLNSQYEEEDSLESLVLETFSMSVLNSEYTKAACKRAWLGHYSHSLSFDKYKEMIYYKSNNIFKLGGSKIIDKKTKKLKLSIMSDVVEYDIPLLLTGLGMTRGRAMKSPP